MLTLWIWHSSAMAALYAAYRSLKWSINGLADS
jgi:hypothetical protein